MQITLCNGRAHKYRRGNQEGSFELGKMKREKGQSKQKTRGPDRIGGLMFPLRLRGQHQHQQKPTNNESGQQCCGFWLMFLAPAGNVAKFPCSTAEFLKAFG